MTAGLQDCTTARLYNCKTAKLLPNCIPYYFFVYCKKSLITDLQINLTQHIQMKKKIVLEYTLNSSPKVIFPRLSTAGGLSEWFADNVNINGSFLSFFWEKTEQRAEVVQRKENKYVRFKWLDPDDPDSQWFEFRINTDEITGDTALIITDFVEDDEKDSTVELWNSQISKLRHVIGL